MIDVNFLTGKSSDHLVPFLETPHLVHKEMHHNLKELFLAAKKDGFDLGITSSFRSYEVQKKIWNEKCQGVRPVLDSQSRPVDITSKTEEQILFLILRWSAIPGGSRHHWGSDLDIYDKMAISPDYKIQLIPSEYELGGPFYQSTLWLNENMESFGFFRPYSFDNNGIAPELWHLSFKPLSELFLATFTYEIFVEHLNCSDFILIDTAKKHSFNIYNRFIQSISR